MATAPKRHPRTAAVSASAAVSAVRQRILDTFAAASISAARAASTSPIPQKEAVASMDRRPCALVIGVGCSTDVRKHHVCLAGSTQSDQGRGEHEPGFEAVVGLHRCMGQTFGEAEVAQLHRTRGGCQEQLRL